MNAFTRQMIMMIGPMILKSLINSMLNEKKLLEYRDKIVAFLRSTADKSANEIDDMAIEEVVKLIMNPTFYAGKTRELCVMARAYVTSTETEWDDMLFIPILDRIELIGTGK